MLAILQPKPHQIHIYIQLTTDPILYFYCALPTIPSSLSLKSTARSEGRLQIWECSGTYYVLPEGGKTHVTWNLVACCSMACGLSKDIWCYVWPYSLLCLLINRADIWPQAKWAVNVMTADSRFTFPHGVRVSRYGLTYSLFAPNGTISIRAYFYELWYDSHWLLIKDLDVSFKVFHVLWASH